MDAFRMMNLLKATVNHIEGFEEDEAYNVLNNLGFTKNELAEIETGIHINEEDRDNMTMVKGWIFHNGEIVWILDRSGEKYIFSDEEETENGWMTERIPFKNYSHYITITEHRGKTIYTGYAWYGKYDNYIEDFHDLTKCLDWLVGKED